MTRESDQRYDRRKKGKPSTLTHEGACYASARRAVSKKGQQKGESEHTMGWRHTGVTTKPVAAAAFIQSAKAVLQNTGAPALSTTIGITAAIC